MISEMAKLDLEDLASQGVQVSPVDAIRLNELGAAVEASQEPGGMWAAPRAAILGNCVFREPCVGHWDFLERAAPRFSDDTETSFWLFAFALAQSTDSLPDPFAPDLGAKVNAFLSENFKPFTIRQISAALVYAVNGRMPARLPHNEEKRDRECNFGLILYGVASGLHVPFADLNKLTRRQLLDAARNALIAAGRELKPVCAVAEYDAYCTLLEELKGKAA